MSSDPTRVIAKYLFGFAALLSVFGSLNPPTTQLKTPAPIVIKPTPQAPVAMVTTLPVQVSESVAIVPVVATPTPTPISTPRPTTAPQMVASTPAPQGVVVAGSVDEVAAAITYWANYYGVDPEWMLRVARCESGLSVHALNRNYYAGGGNPTGVLQFLPQTFYANAARVGIDNANIWDYRQQAQVAAWMFANNQSRQWECK